MARPTKAIKRTERITVRYTISELRLVQRFAERSGLRTAEFVHDRSLSHKIRSRLTEEELHIYRNLVGMANNLNQLTKLAHDRRLLTVELLKVSEAINDSIEKLR